eukprot:g6154.t1
MDPTHHHETEHTAISGLDFRRPDSVWNRPQTKKTLSTVLISFVFVLALVAIILAGVALSRASDDDDGDVGKKREETLQSQVPATPVRLQTRLERDHPISRIAFGSCSVYHRYPQTFWTTGVIPSQPDAWIWLGDFIYLDSGLGVCPREGYQNISDCNCEVTVMHRPPYNCFGGNITYAREKARVHLLDDDYYRFLSHMCPNMNQSIQFPPKGDSCEKPIMGTYDDHDYGWNNGNRYLPNKFEFKNLYLDSIGVEQESVRRRVFGGLEYKYTLNAEHPLDQQIDVFLLDERYNRDALPCGVRREWCNGILSEGEEGTYNYVWCSDFLNTGGPANMGSCCGADDVWANGWCNQTESPHQDDDLWDIACDPSSERYGSMLLEVNETTDRLIPKHTYNRSDLTYSSTFCDVLGINQRRWFQRELKNSKAALKIIASGSVLLGNPIPGNRGPCSSDDIECYKPAQANLIHILNSTDNGCVLVLTGDYHMSDIKILQEEGSQNYSQYYPVDNLKRPIYQVMASGLTWLTARPRPREEQCVGWRRDQVGLRPLGPCSNVVRPAFGMVDVDWELKIVHLQLLSTDDGSVAEGFDGSHQVISFDLETCKRI